MLGIGRDASPDEVKRAYRQAARTWHPDRNPAPDAAERFKAVSRAFELLSDASRRRAHDLRAGRAGRGSLPEDFVEDVASAIERAQTWIEEQVLPHYAEDWRGRGAEVAARLWVDLERLIPARMLVVTAKGRRRAAPLLQGIQVTMDERPAGGASALIPGRKLSTIVIFPAALYTVGFREAVDLDDAVLRLLLARYAQHVATGRLLALPGMDDEMLVARGRAIDDEAVRAWRNRVVLWSTVALIATGMFVAAYNGW